MELPCMNYRTLVVDQILQDRLLQLCTNARTRLRLPTATAPRAPVLLTLLSLGPTIQASDVSEPR